MQSSEWSDRILTALAEQLKMPLIQIAQLSELSKHVDNDNAAIATLSRTALRSIDSLLLSQQQTAFDLEPVSVGAVFYDAAHELSAIAKQKNIFIEIDNRARGSVMAHASGLQTLLEILGGVLLELPSGNSAARDKAPRIILGCHRTQNGVVVGVFRDTANLSHHSLTMTRKLYGQAMQPSPELGLSGGATLVIADKLASQLRSALRVYQHSLIRGLGSVLAPSRQLRLEL